MKKLLLFAILIASFTTIYADNIDRNAAYEKAVSFMQQKNPSIRFNKNKALKIVGKTTENTLPYYVFNAESNQGFVIVSGNDQTEPIMGYSENGSFDSDNIPPALQFMLDRYAEELDSINAEEPINDNVNNPRKVVSLPRTAIEPFCTRLWGQSSPYYNSAPMFDGGRCAIGCLAVAVSIAMGYYNWPEVTTSIPAYVTTTNKISMDELKPLTIDWKNMLDEYFFQTTSAQRAAVSNFMLYVCQALKVDFLKGIAGNAVVSSAIYGLTNYFDYDSNLYHTNCTDFETINDFTDVVYTELSQGRPVIFDGFSLSTPTSNAAGHAFVCDGYDQNDMFHINWGWLGFCNGYFRLTMLNPYKTTRNRNYTRNLGVMLGLQPNGWKENTGMSYPTEDMSLQFLSINPNDNGIRITLQNGYNTKQTFENAIAIYDNNLNFVKLISDIDTTTFNKNGWSYKTYSSISYENVADGIYKVIPVSRICGEEKWHFDRCLGTYAYLEAIVDEGKISYSPIETLVVNSFSVLESDKGNGIGAPQTAILKITNNSFDNYNKNMYLFANKQLNMIQGLRIPMNSTVEIPIEFVPYVAGDYKLEICKDAEGDFPIASTTTIVNDIVNYGDESSNYRIISAKIINDNANVINGVGNIISGNYKVTFSLTNIDSVQVFNDYIRFSLSIDQSVVSAWESTKLEHVRLLPGETKIFTYESNELLWKDKSYVFRIMTKWNSLASMDNVNDWSKSSSYQVFATPYTIARAIGIRYWTGDGNTYGLDVDNNADLIIPENAVAVSFDTDSNTWPTNIIPNDNPNTLYYFNGQSKYSNIINVINNGIAENITLIDGYPVFVPEDFHANNISYKRTFYKGCEGNKNLYNWSTIILPFDVQKVTNTIDNVDIDWFHNSDELFKDFWLCKYHGKENYDLLFDYANEFKANTSYIISVSGNERTDSLGLIGKPIEFSSKDVEILHGKLFEDTYDFDFEGTFTGSSITDKKVYMFTDEEYGNSFDYVGTNATINPFRAFFISEVDINSLSEKLTINILHENKEMTGINNKYSNDKYDSYLYDLSGKKLLNGKRKKGIYIKNGKKYINVL